MATAFAKHTGRLGVCLATTGHGAAHTVNGLDDAKNDDAPVLSGDEARRRQAVDGQRRRPDLVVVAAAKLPA